MFPSGSEGGCDEVTHYSIVGERHKRMPEALRDVDGASIALIEQYGVPFAEGR